MKNCDCKEPCEDCKHEDVNLDHISNVLFNNINQKETEDKKEENSNEKETEFSNSEDKKTVKKEIKKIECENTNYKDPVSEEYKIKRNDISCFDHWDLQPRNMTF